MSCPNSQRGHRWRETPPGFASNDKLPTPLRPRVDARFCACGAAGIVDGQGVVKTLYEPGAKP